MMKLIKNSKRLIISTLILIVLNGIATNQFNAYFYYIYCNEDFLEIINNEQFFYFEKIKKLFVINIEEKCIIDMILQPFNYKMKMENINSDVIKIILLPKTYDNINLYGTNFQGSYMIECYLYKDELNQLNAEKIFDTIEKQRHPEIITNTNIKLTNGYDIAKRFNTRHYDWCAFIKFFYKNKSLFENDTNKFYISCLIYMKINVYSLSLNFIDKNLRYYYLILIPLLKK